MLDEHQDVDALQQHGVHVQEIDREDPAAWAARNCRQVGPERRGPGSMPAAWRISQTVDGATVTPSFASSPWIRRCPHNGFSLASRSTRRLTPVLAGGRPAVRPPAGVVLLRSEPAVPDQERCRADGEDFGPMPARHEPCQRGEPHPAGRHVSHSASLSAQHRVLVPEHQQLSILRPVATAQQDDQAEYPARQHVDDLQQHPAS